MSGIAHVGGARQGRSRSKRTVPVTRKPSFRTPSPQSFRRLGTGRGCKHVDAALFPTTPTLPR